MKDLYRKFKCLTGYNYEVMAGKAGVTKQHIQASMGNCSMIYKTSMAAIMNLCIDDRISELKDHIEELEALKKEILIKSINKDSELMEVQNESK